MEAEAAPPPTADERALAMLAHVLQLFSGFVGPLIIYLVKRDSRFVAFHAVQAIIWQVVFLALAMLSMVACFVVMFSTVLTHPSSSNGPPAGSFVAFPLILLVWMGGGVIGIILAIVYGVKANQGEWAGYPVIGRWARRLARG